MAAPKVSFAYFTNWGIYGANFQPQDINSSILTHILYSFADTDSTTGLIKLTDSYSDEEKHYPNDSWSDSGTNVYGCIKQLYLLKLKQRNLKVLLSIGGWTYSQAGHFNWITNPDARNTFVESALKIVEDYGFDGIDIDYEYPSTPEQGQALADLFTQLRSAFTEYQNNKGDTVPYLLTAAVAAGPSNYVNLNIKQMDEAMDYWNLMAYDYAGSWNTYSDHQANVYGGERTGFNTDQAVRHYISNGASPGKLVMGLPLYGRAFQETDGIGHPYNGIGQGTIEAGIYSYKVLPHPGAEIIEDCENICGYSYDPAKRELVSYDTPNVIRMKTDYIKKYALAGTMFWELSTDRTGTPESLVQVAVDGLGGTEVLDQSPNHINYPNSKWDNIKKNMEGCDGGGGGGAPVPSDPAPTPGDPSGPGGVAPWSASQVYTGGMKATYEGHCWTAAWWTQGDIPGGAVGVWKDDGPY